jgi:hypothetical protein
MTAGNLIVPRFADRALMPTAVGLLLWSALVLALWRWRSFLRSSLLRLRLLRRLRRPTTIFCLGPGPWRLLLLRSPVVAPGLAFGQRVQATAAKLGSVAGIVWAGSQVTKVFRLSGAIVMAPVVDKLMSWTQTKFNLTSRNAAFWAIIGALWGTLFVFYGSLILYGTALG